MAETEPTGRKEEKEGTIEKYKRKSGCQFIIRPWLMRSYVCHVNILISENYKKNVDVIIRAFLSRFHIWLYLSLWRISISTFTFTFDSFSLSLSLLSRHPTFSSLSSFYSVIASTSFFWFPSAEVNIRCIYLLNIDLPHYSPSVQAIRSEF